jgi:GntR family transcriptional repressor for pyruvate dehydrogenase complex
MFDAVRVNKASQQIVSQIKTQIFQGKLAPGDRLPSETVLMEQFHVSKQTLREALRALEYLGLIEVRKGIGGGAQIIEVDIEVAKDILANFLYFKNLSIHNLSEARLTIEPHTAWQAALNRTGEDLKKMEELIAASGTEMTEPFYTTHMAGNDLEFHRVIAGTTKNPIFVLMVDFIESLLADMKSVLKPDVGFSTSVFDAHNRIYHAIRDKDPQRASDEMYQHILAVENSLVTFGDDNNPWRRSK